MHIKQCRHLQSYYQTVLYNNTFLKVLIKRNWHFQRVTGILQTFSTENVPYNTFFSLMWVYSKSSVSGIGAKSTFTINNVFHIKKLKIIEYTAEIFIFCYDYKHLPFSNKPYPPAMNLPGLLMPCPGLLHVTI